MRLFISIDLPAECRQRISQRMAACAVPNLKPVSADQLHITLAFLGSQSLTTLEHIEQVLAELNVPRLQLTCAEIHSFSGGIIWLGVTPSPALLQFQQQLCHRLRQAGVSLEARKYIPHITLFRRKGAVTAEQLAMLNTAFAGITLRFQMDAIWLKESQLHADGAVHQVVAGFH